MHQCLTPIRTTVHSSWAAGSSGHVQERLDHIDLKHSIFLPQIQHSYYLTLETETSWTSWASMSINKHQRTYSNHLNPRKIKYIAGNTLLTHPILCGTQAQVLECSHDVFGEPGPKDIFVSSKLMPWLSHNGIHHIETRDFVLRLALIWGEYTTAFNKIRGSAKNQR